MRHAPAQGLLRGALSPRLGRGPRFGSIASAPGAARPSPAERAGLLTVGLPRVSPEVSQARAGGRWPAVPTPP